MKNIAGIFYDSIHTNRAIATLLDKGFSKSDISIIMSDEAKKRHFHDNTDSEEVAAAGGAGAAAGGVLGGLLAGFAVVGGIAIPGVSLLAAGPILAVLSGVGAGAAVGGLAGALTSAGVNAAEAGRYEDEIKKGNIVLVVQTKNENEMIMAHEVMRQQDAMTEAV